MFQPTSNNSRCSSPSSHAHAHTHTHRFPRTHLHTHKLPSHTWDIYSIAPFQSQLENFHPERITVEWQEALSAVEAAMQPLLGLTTKELEAQVRVLAPYASEHVHDAVSISKLPHSALNSAGEPVIGHSAMCKCPSTAIVMIPAFDGIHAYSCAKGSPPCRRNIQI